METIEPPGVAKFDPRGMAGTIYVEDHCYIPNIEAVGPVVSEKKIFGFFSIKICMLPWQPEFQSDLPKNNL